MTEDQIRTLQAKLWAVADILRGRMDADEYRDYILGLIFYRYLSEIMQAYADDVLKNDGLTYEAITEGTPEGIEILEAVRHAAVGQLGYFLLPSELFGAMAHRGTLRRPLGEGGAQKGDPGFIIDDLKAVLRNIETSTLGTASQDDFDDLFSDMDLANNRLGRTAETKNDTIARILITLAEIDFRLDEADGDILGDAYEYLIGEFAATAGKKAGEFYTPAQVSTILTRIVATEYVNGHSATPRAQTKPRIRSVYDPCCGSGSLLLRFRRDGIEIGNFYGQELNRTTYNLARMNMILHGVRYDMFDLRQDDTLEHPAPAHADMRFEAVVANPPFSAKWSAADSFHGDERFGSFPRLPPASKADYCFVLHMLHHLADDGTMAVILPHGALFRAGAEGEIRQHLIREKNWLDAVIGLPPNVFYGTSIPACIMVFRKCREADDDVMIIDASRHFTKVKNRNELADEDVERIVDAWRGRAAVDRLARPVPLAEIEGNGFNLNIPRYVDTSEPEVPVDLAAVTAELRRIDGELADSAAEIRAYCEELGIEAPV